MSSPSPSCRLDLNMIPNVESGNLFPQPGGLSTMNEMLLQNERAMANKSDTDAINATLAANRYAAASLTNIARRLHARANETRQLHEYVARLQGSISDCHQKIKVLRQKNKELKRMANVYATDLEPRMSELEGSIDQIKIHHERLVTVLESYCTDAPPKPSQNDSAEK